MISKQFPVRTSSALITDITKDVVQFCEGRGSGLLHIFAPHATAGIALMETGSGSGQDLAEALSRLLPRDNRYTHQHGSAGHGADHLLPTLLAPFAILAVIDSAPVLGTWQSVVVVDTNQDRPDRTVRFTFMTDES